jgi:hypothetical protein
VIASLTEVGPALAGKAGTHIVPDGAAKGAAKRGARRTPANATHNRHRRRREAVPEEVVS